jgi:hypothetical protein
MSEYDKIIEYTMSHGVVRNIQLNGLLMKKGKTYTHHECERRLKAAWGGTTRWFSRTLRTRTTWNEADMNKHEMERMRYLLDDMQTYIEVVQQELDRIEGLDRKAERIKALRNITGRSPEEAALFLEKAAQLEGE